MRERRIWILGVIATLVVAFSVYFALLEVTSRLYAAAIAYALGFSAGGVVQGSKGSGNSMAYHVSRSRWLRLWDYVFVGSVTTASVLVVGVVVSSVAGQLTAELGVLFVAAIVSEITFSLHLPDDASRTHATSE